MCNTNKCNGAHMYYTEAEWALLKAKKGVEAQLVEESCRSATTLREEDAAARGFAHCDAVLVKRPVCRVVVCVRMRDLYGYLTFGNDVNHGRSYFLFHFPLCSFSWADSGAVILFGIFRFLWRGHKATRRSKHKIS